MDGDLVKRERETLGRIERMNDEGAYNPRFYWFAVFTAAATLVLIGSGGIVTSKGAGMAVPDWPNTYGYNMFFFPFSQWIGGVFWEHSHRLAGAGVGLLTLMLAVWSFGQGVGRLFLCRILAPLLGLGGVLCFVLAKSFAWDEARVQDGILLAALGAIAGIVGLFWPRSPAAPRRIRCLAGIAVAIVIGQGVLGGLRVRLMQDEIGIVHAALAHLFFVLVAVIALFASRWWMNRDSQSAPTLKTRAAGWMLAALAAVIFGQLLLGAAMRHKHAGLPVSGFPLSEGRFWPSADEASVQAANKSRGRTADYRDFPAITRGHILLYRGHLVLALAIFAAASLLFAFRNRLVLKDRWLANLLVVWFLFICVQGLLGAATVWSNKAADIATLHVVFGALALALASLLSMISFRLAKAARHLAAEPASSLSGLAEVAGRRAGMARSRFS